MSIQINTKIGSQKSSNALSNLNNQMKNIQVKLATQKSPNNIIKKSSSINIGKTLGNKVKQMDKEKEDIGLAKTRLASVESQLKSIQNELKQLSPEIKRISSPANELSEIAKAIKVIGSEIDSNFKINNSFTDYDTVETDLANVLGNISNLEQKLDSKSKFLTTAIANAQASLSRLSLPDMTMRQLNKEIDE